jgi:hypothetical protein
VLVIAPGFAVPSTAAAVPAPYGILTAVTLVPAAQKMPEALE